jgi:hypothetical protein
VNSERVTTMADGSKAERAALYALVAVEVPALFSVYNPSMFFTTRRFASEDGSVKDIRRGSAMATANALVLGVAVAVIDHSWWPIIIALALSAAMWYGYEWSIAHPREDAQDMAGTPVGRS